MQVLSVQAVASLQNSLLTKKIGQKKTLKKTEYGRIAVGGIAIRIARGTVVE
jgi:hypothetical protein